MRIAIFADIHGNSIALDAVLSDINRNGGVDEYWVLGDIVCQGHDPIGVIDRLLALKNISICRGNTDRYVYSGARPFPSMSDVEKDITLMPIFEECTATFACTEDAIHAAGKLDWLSELPLELTCVLPCGQKLLGVHSSPGQDDGIGIPPDISIKELESILRNCDSDIICVGHTHWHFDIRAFSKHVVSVGSVSNPMANDLRAFYSILTVDNAGYKFDHYKIEYDLKAVIEAVEKLKHPGAKFIKNHFLGNRKPRWDMNIDANERLSILKRSAD